MADAIFYRLVQNAHRINLIGDSMRQKYHQSIKQQKSKIRLPKKRKFSQNSTTKRCALTVQVRWTGVQVLMVLLSK